MTRDKNIPHRRLVLASASPRRKTLLSTLGLDFTITPAHVDEAALPDETPRAHTRRLAVEKATRCSMDFKDSIVLAADTVVSIDGLILGKPSDEKDAERMLHLISGRPHIVVTSFCLMDTKGEDTDGPTLGTVESTVFIRELSAEEILDYVKTGEPMDKAGAYAVQGLGKRLVEKVMGSYTNVVGLPMEEVEAALVQKGLLRERTGA